LVPHLRGEQILIFENRVLSRGLGLRNRKYQENGANCITMIFQIVLFNRHSYLTGVTKRRKIKKTDFATSEDR
jgi:hypothetical protein